MAQYGFAHKLQDPPKAVTESFGKNPFDGFAVVEGQSIYWEAKLLKGYKAFAFSSIRDHQLEALKDIRAAKPDAQCWIVLGIYEPRKSKHLYFFDIDHITYLINEEMKSIKKKELNVLWRGGWYVEIKKEGFDVPSIWRKIINGTSKKATQDQAS